MTDRLLFEQFPGARASIPWMRLATLPTPITDVEIAGVRIPVKRDDLTGDVYGGNKVRKLEFLLAHAKERGATRVVTAGAFGSHHSLATSIYARRAGLDATVVLFPQRITSHVRSILLSIAASGAEIRFTRRMEFVPVALRRVRRAHGERAVIIPPGGSDARGTLGYVECGLELAAQLSASGREMPVRIHVAAGTLGTVAGLALGLAIAGVDCEIAATRITSRLVTNERALALLVEGASNLLRGTGATMPVLADVLRRVHFVHDQIGDGYGRTTPAADDAAAQFARAGFTLDTTYTAKAAAALLADPLTAAGRTLFINTLSAIEPEHDDDAATIARLPRPIAASLDKMEA